MVALNSDFLLGSIMISIYMLENFATFFSNYAASNKVLL